MVMGIHQQWRIAPDAVDLERAYAAAGTLLRGRGATE
jgi:TetR/AcrR family acrAB operon transcriptional repressor